jgi:hypothetical protein
MRDYAFQGIIPCPAPLRRKLAMNEREAMGRSGNLRRASITFAAARIRMSEIAGMSGLAGAVLAAAAIV